MFTGIIEATGLVDGTRWQGDIFEMTIRSDISSFLHVDQSVSHDGVCLTVVGVSGDTHRVQLVRETLERSHFKTIGTGSLINLERAMPANGRFEGHFVQGHVDCEGEIVSIKDGIYSIRYPGAYAKYLTEKGSVSVNGVSLTVARLSEDVFGVAIIPYTLSHTNFRDLAPGSKVNLEFDMLAKHIVRVIQLEGLTQ